jgi:hypothetical protein
MNQQQQSVVLAGLLAVALALSGCTGMRSSEDAGETGGSTLGSSTSGGGQSGTSGATGTGGSGSYGAGSKTDTSGNPMGTRGSSGTSGSSGASGAMGSGTASTAGQPQEGAISMPNSTVLAIEPVPKSVGATGAVGSSGAAGTTGSSGAGQAYRITLRMDDGSTQVVTQETMPDFRSGDRVQVESGVIRH